MKRRIIFFLSSLFLAFTFTACGDDVNSLPSSTSMPSASPTLTATRLPTKTLTTTPTPSLTLAPAPILINPSAIISEDTVEGLVLLETLKLKAFIYSIAFSQDGSLLAAAPRGSKIKLWNVSTLEELETLVYTDEYNTAQLYSRSEDQILVVKSSDRGMTISDITTGAMEYPNFGYAFRWWNKDDPAISKDGSLMAVASTVGQLTENIIIWDLKDQKKIQTLYGDWTTDDVRGYPTAGIAYLSPDGSLLAAEISDGRSIVWDVASGERVAEFYNKRVYGFSHDGTMMAASVSSHSIGVYDTTTWEPMNFSIYIPELGNSIKFTLDDELLMVLDRYGGITFWNWKTRETVRTISPFQTNTPRYYGQLLVLSPDGKLLVTCYNDKLEDGMEEATIDIWGVP